MTGVLFTITEAGRVVGLGLVCAEARYCSVRWAGADRLDRCHLAANDWPLVGAIFKDGMSTRPLEASNVIAATLTAGRPGVAVQWLARLPVEAAEPSTVSANLDRLLRSQALPG